MAIWLKKDNFHIRNKGVTLLVWRSVMEFCHQKSLGFLKKEIENNWSNILKMFTKVGIDESYLLKHQRQKF